MKDAERVLPSYQLFSLTSCNLCGATERDILFSVSDVSIPATAVICKRCGLIYLKEALSQEAARQFYASDDWRSIVYSQKTSDTSSEKLFQNQVGRAKLAVDFIESTIGNISGKRCLDIGCGPGGFVHVLRDIGAIAVGVEPSANHSEYGIKRYGLEIMCNSFEDLTIDANYLDIVRSQPLSLRGAERRSNLQGGWQVDRRRLLRFARNDTSVGSVMANLTMSSYDLILCVRTLNHLLDPTQALSKIRTLLAPTGSIYLEVLNFPHAIRRKSLSKCVKIDHPYMFSTSTLLGLLDKCGFEVVTFDCDLNGTREFGSLNHIHVIARLASLPGSFSPSPLAAIEAKTECAFAVAQYLSGPRE